MVRVDGSRLREQLQQFIDRHLQTALGEEVWRDFAPPLGSPLSELLSFVRRRWFAVFSETRLADVGYDAVCELERRCRRAERGDPAVDEARQQMLLGQLSRVLNAPERPRNGARAAAPRQDDLLPPPTADAPLNGIVDGSPADERMQVEPGVDSVYTHPTKPLAVVDGENVGWQYGQGVRFQPRGIQLCAEHLRQRGYRVVVFLPHYRRRHAALPSLAEGMYVFTPPGDYDDTFALAYALRHRGILVTNDQLRDHLDQFYEHEEAARERMRAWLGRHRCSFTFAGEEFIPHPSFFV